MATAVAKRPPAEIAAEFKAAVAQAGMRWSAHDGVASVSAAFPAGDMEAAIGARRAAERCLRILPQSRPGSTWGGDGIGLAIACNAGFVTVNRSGINRFVVRAL